MSEKDSPHVAEQPEVSASEPTNAPAAETKAAPAEPPSGAPSGKDSEPTKAQATAQVKDAPSGPPALSISLLTHAFKSHVAVDGVSFTVDSGSIHGFVGPNGAGKTTTLKVVATLLRPDQGQVRVFGHDVIRETHKVRSLLGFMPDHFSMYRQMTVFEYLDFFAAAYGLKMAERDRVIQDVLALTDMDGRKDDIIQGLSRGMQQRVSLARLLVNDPKLLLLDEPASGLDPRARIELMEIIRELRRMGKTIFISSHILSELADLCDSVTIIDRGKVKYSGSMRGLLKQDGDSKVYEFILGQHRETIGEVLRKLEGVTAVSHDEEEGPEGWRTYVTIDPHVTDSAALIRAVLDNGGQLESFRESLRQLNQVFMELTQAGVRS